MRVALGMLALVLVCGLQRPAGAETFSNWAAVVVAADWRAGDGKPTAAFDNARRDVAAALIRSGFRPENLRSYSAAAGAEGVEETSVRNVFSGLTSLSRRAQGGCLVYLTSHGSPDGIIFGRNGHLPPARLAGLLDATCRDRPTVVMISACFSGVFVPALASPERLVFTAARRDRSSFGCGEDDVYPVFDSCVLESFPRAPDFLALGRAVQACVTRKETELKFSPASEPQISAGARIRPLLPLMALQPETRPHP